MNARAPDLTLVRHALDAYSTAVAEAAVHTPGGHLFEHDLAGIRKRVARDHGITPEDLARWVEADKEGRNG